jgi:hypothetical protein
MVYRSSFVANVKANIRFGVAAIEEVFLMLYGLKADEPLFDVDD